MFNTSNQRNLIGIEFAADAMRLIQLGGTAAAPTVQATAVLPGTRWLMDETTPADGTSRRLKELLKASKFTGNSCAMVLPSAAVFCESVEVPALANDEMRESITWTAVDRLGVDRAELVTGHLPIRNGTLGGPTSEVLVIATRKAVVNKAIGFLALAGLEVRRAELGAMAATRLGWNHVKKSGRSANFAVLHLEPERAMLAVMNGNGLAFHRSFKWESSVDLTPDAIPMAGEQDESHAWHWRQLAEEILQCLRHVERRPGAAWPEHIILSGPLAEEPGIASAIRSVCGAKVELLEGSSMVDWAGHIPVGGMAAWSAALSVALPEGAQAAAPARKVA